MLLAQSSGPTYQTAWGPRGRVLAKRLFGPVAVVETLPGAMISQVSNFPRDWDRGWPGARNRLASQYGQFAISELTEFFVAPALNEDPRYERLGSRFPFGQRVKRAVVGTFWVRQLQGDGHTVAFSRFAGAFASWGVASRWHPPEHRDFSEFAWRGSMRLGVKVGGNAFREFWPDIRQRLRRR